MPWRSSVQNSPVGSPATVTHSFEHSTFQETFFHSAIAYDAMNSVDSLSPVNEATFS